MVPRAHRHTQDTGIYALARQDEQTEKEGQKKRL